MNTCHPRFIPLIRYSRVIVCEHSASLCESLKKPICNCKDRCVVQQGYAFNSLLYIEFNSSPYFVGSILIMEYFALDRKQLNGTHFHTNTSVYGVKVSWTMMMAVKSVQFVCHCLKLRTMLDVCPACISSIWIVWINGWLRTNTVPFVVSISKLGSIKIS